MDEGGNVLFSARSQPGVSYEFVNTPPEPFDDTRRHHHPEDHFQFYYDLFPASFPSGLEKFQFLELSPPGERPFLCGKIFLGESTTPFE